MIEREVLQVRRSRSGEVVALVNKGEAWAPRHAGDAIDDIRSGVVRYVVPWATHRAPVRVIGAAPARLDAGSSVADTGGLSLLPHG